ncbi:acyl-CoA-binding protein [Bacteroidetes bacterium UKL13-3]|jgi:diazepam-binding inhibitor (GABA receptor modulating acyl-CoA-binding protein)|nr:acyl-CoA-binding protein [Bacteroidetes bacterium UKL13-3]HCP94746.1 acyl-CoA-binding protein [Bacteroidota bacterium]
MSLEKQFEQASKDVHTLTERPGNDVLLNLYSLHKQASVGDVNADEPGRFDFIAKAKYNAWATKKGLSREDAMQQYVDLVNSLLASN